MRKKIVAGNWKMNMSIQEGFALVNDIVLGLPGLSEERQVVIAPPFTHLILTGTQIAEINHLHLAGQNCHTETYGAYTGEISAAMLKGIPVKYVIVGHSERREYFGEDDATIAKKVNAALDNDLHVIFCCGEPLAIRDAGTENEYVGAQVKASLFHLTPEQLSRISVAYEPIWAIGTGRTATTEQAQNMHAHIRGIIAAQYGHEAAQNMSILYGGSCKPSNAPELFACPDVDGGLIGGAALKSTDFLGIVYAMMNA